MSLIWRRRSSSYEKCLDLKDLKDISLSSFLSENEIANMIEFNDSIFCHHTFLLIERAAWHRRDEVKRFVTFVKQFKGLLPGKLRHCQRLGRFLVQTH